MTERRGPLFDEDFYLATHPDVAELVAVGKFPSGLAHFERVGEGEGREFRTTSALLGLEFEAVVNDWRARRVGICGK